MSDYTREAELALELARVTAKRDALAEKLAESDHALMQLGRLKAQWQAEALEPIINADSAAEVLRAVAELRRQAGEAKTLRQGLQELQSIGGWKDGRPPTFREQMIDRYGSWEEYQRQAEEADQ